MALISAAGRPRFSCRSFQRRLAGTVNEPALAARQTLSPEIQCSCDRFQPHHSHQVIGAGHKVCPSLCSLPPTVTSSSQPTYRFDPAKDLLYPLSDSQARDVSGLGGSAGIQSGNLHALLARNMRRQLPLAAAFHKGSLMVALIRTDRLGLGCAMQLSVLVQLPQRHHRLGVADRVVNRKVGAQSMSVLHQNVTTKAELGFFAFGFAIEHALGIRRALMRIITTLFAMKTYGGVTRIVLLGALV